MQKLISVSVIIVTVCCLSLKGSSAWFLDNGEDTWRDPQPRSHNQPKYPRHKPSWRWRSRRRVYKPKTTAKPAPIPTTTAPPGPEFCRNHTIVFHVKDEPGPVVCLRKNATELMRQLKETGGFIKRYTAVKVMDACGFEDLTSIENMAGPTATPQSATENTTLTTTMPLLGKRQVTQQELQRRKRSLPTSPGTVFRGCQGRGTIPDGTTTHRLCTECAATTRLGNDRFPIYINEVVCRDTDFQCAATMGLCFQRSLQLPFLRSTGNFQFDPFLSSVTGKTVYKEVWDEYTQEIRSCCECQMYSPIYNKITTRDD